MGIIGFYQTALSFARRHIVLYGTVKFLSGLIIGFALGIYFLPIIIADAPVEREVIERTEQQAERSTVFHRDLPASDSLHWGEGTLYVTSERVTLDGEVSPGPDYRLYLTPDFVDTKEGFISIKEQSREVARIKGFKNFSYEIEATDLSAYHGALIWCERFSVFITAGELR